MFRWELEDLAREQLAGMPPPVQLALSDFMDAVVIVDPAEYQRRPDEPEPFGSAILSGSSAQLSGKPPPHSDGCLLAAF